MHELENSSKRIMLMEPELAVADNLIRCWEPDYDETWPGY